MEELHEKCEQLRVKLAQIESMVERGEYIHRSLHTEILEVKQASYAKMKGDFESFIEKFRKDYESSALAESLRHQSEVNVLESKLMRRSRKFHDLSMRSQETVRTLEEKILQTNEEKQQMNVKNHLTEGNIARWQEKVETLKEEVKSLQEEKSKTEEKISKLKQRNEEVQRALEASEEARKKPERGGTPKSRSSFEVSQSHEEEQRKRETVQLKERLIEEIRELRGSLINVSAQLASAHSMVEFKDEIIKNLKDQLAELKAENSSLTAQFFDIYQTTTHKTVRIYQLESVTRRMFGVGGRPTTCRGGQRVASEVSV